MYVWRNIVVLSSNQCRSGKAILITYFECVSLASGIQHSTRICHVAFFDLPGCTTFSTLSHKRHFFEKKNIYWIYRVTIKEIDTFNVMWYQNRHRSGHTICVVEQRKDEKFFPGILSWLQRHVSALDITEAKWLLLW